MPTMPDEKPDGTSWHHKDNVRWVRCIGRRTNPFSGTKPELKGKGKRDIAYIDRLGRGKGTSLISTVCEGKEL